jgi:hypothetical protein
LIRPPCANRFVPINRSSAVERAMAQMKPAISRAIAVVTTTLGLPAAARRRQRLHNRRHSISGVASCRVRLLVQSRLPALGDRIHLARLPCMRLCAGLPAQPSYAVTVVAEVGDFVLVVLILTGLPGFQSRMQSPHSRPRQMSSSTSRFSTRKRGIPKYAFNFNAITSSR